MTDVRWTLGRLQLATLYRRAQVRAGTVERMSKRLVSDVVCTVMSRHMGACGCAAVAVCCVMYALTPRRHRLCAQTEGCGEEVVFDAAAGHEP